MSDEKSDLHRDYVLELETELRELEEREQAATRRLQLLVYPSLLAFIILASYGFYMVQSLTSNVAHMSKSMVVISESINDNMGVIGTSIVQMSDKMSSIVASTQSMTGKMGNLVDSTTGMKNDVGTMTSSINDMNMSTLSMAESTQYMQQDMMSLNHNISKPLSMFNNFIPWNSNTVGRYTATRRPLPVPAPLESVKFYQPKAPVMPVMSQTN